MLPSGRPGSCRLKVRARRACCHRYRRLRRRLPHVPLGFRPETSCRRKAMDRFRARGLGRRRPRRGAHRTACGPIDAPPHPPAVTFQLLPESPGRAAPRGQAGRTSPPPILSASPSRICRMTMASLLPWPGASTIFLPHRRSASRYSQPSRWLAAGPAGRPGPARAQSPFSRRRLRRPRGSRRRRCRLCRSRRHPPAGSRRRPGESPHLHHQKPRRRLGTYRGPGLGVQGEITEAAARERSAMCAAKFLKRVLGK